MPNNYTFDLNSAISAGYTPDQIAQYLDAQKKQGNNYQLTSKPQATPQQSQQPAQPKSNGFADLLPTIGSVVGGIAGAAIPVLGETGLGEVGGAAAGSGLGETAKELIEGKPLDAGDIAGQTALGGVGGVAGKVIGKVAGVALPKLGQGLTQLGDNAAIRTLRATPSQLTNFQKIHGEDIAPVLTRNNIVGQDVTGIQAKAIDPLQDQFNAIANNKNIAVPTSTMDSHALDTISTLLKSPSQEDHQLAQNLLDDYSFAVKQMGDNPTLADINSARQTFDSKVSDWKNDPIAAGKNRLLGNIFRGATQDTAAANGLSGVDGQSLQDMGTELSKLYNIKDIAGRQANLGRGTMPIGLTTLLGLGGGSALAGIPGAIGGAMITRAANSPLATALESKILTGTGSTLQKTVNPVAGKIASQIAGQATLRGLASPTTTSGQSNILPSSPGFAQPPDMVTDGSNNNQNPNQNNTLPSSPQAAFGNNSTINSIGSQALPATPGTKSLQGYTINGKAIDPATANLIQKVADYQIDPTKITSLKNDERQRLVSLASQYDPSYDSSSFPAKAAVIKDFTSGKSAQNVRSLNTAIAHLSALADAGGALGNTSFTPYNQLKNSISQTTGQPQVTRFNDSLNAVAGEMATVFKGTSGTDQEIKSWKDQMGSAQSPAQIQAGINQMIELMSGRLQALNSQYQTGRGKPPAVPFLDANSQKILQNFGIDPSTLTGSDALPATP